MERQIYPHLESIFSSKDLKECGRSIVAFSQAALASDRRAALIKAYYKRILNIDETDTRFCCPAEPYKIYTGSAAVLRYLSVHSPARYADVKVLSALRSMGKEMSEEFILPEGKLIGKKQIEQVLDYAEGEFGFADKVFCRQRPIFVLLTQRHRQGSSCWCKTQSGDEDVVCVFLYPCGSPVQDLFLQLAKILYYRCECEPGSLDFAAIEAMEELYCMDVKSLPWQKQIEVTVNGLCLGMMHESPFEPAASGSSNMKEKRNQLKRTVKRILSKL